MSLRRRIYISLFYITQVLSLTQAAYHGGDKLRCRALSAQILCEHLSVIQHAIQRFPNLLAVVFEIHMVQQFYRAQQHRRRIRNILANRLRIRVPCTLLKRMQFSNITAF